jgi:phage terminase small subunit
MTNTTTTKPKRTTGGNRSMPKGTRKLNNGVRLASGLTVHQEAYCRARATGMSMEESVMAIGSPVAVTTARDWERKLQPIRDRIAELSQMATNNAILKTGLDREWIISRLMSVVDRCMQAEPVLDREGKPTGEFQFNSTGANGALKMLGDTMGLFKPAEKKPEDEYANLSDDDITRIVAELAAQTGLIEIGAGTQEATGSQQVIEVQALPKAG